jgi:hypothetical protein
MIFVTIVTPQCHDDLELPKIAACNNYSEIFGLSSHELLGLRVFTSVTKRIHFF